ALVTAHFDRRAQSPARATPARRRRARILDRSRACPSQTNVDREALGDHAALRCFGGDRMRVHVQKNDHVTTVLIDRPERRNAIARPTAEDLANAFRAFAADDDAYVAVLTGVGGNFCAGADLKAIAAGEGNNIQAEGDGPLGPTRMLLPKPVIAAISGYA